MTDMQKKLLIGGGIALALLLAAIVFLHQRKPAPATKKPGQPASKNPLDTISNAVKSVTVDKTLTINVGDTGPEVDYLQDAIGEEYGNNPDIPVTGGDYTASGKWDPASEAVVTAIYKTYGQTYVSPISITDFETLTAQKPATA